jgi:hypothetical protein
MAEQFTSRQTERRAWVRSANAQDVVCIVDDAQTGWMGRVRDISRCGIALTLRRRFEPGTALIVELESKTGRLRCLPVQVVQSTRDANDRCIVGCAFVSPLGEADYKASRGSRRRPTGSSTAVGRTYWGEV